MISLTLNRENKPLIIWVTSLLIALFTLVLVGGATRVTDSGLSITEWEPVIGVLPPFTLESWMIEFNKYKLIPEYSLINYQMTLTEFKVIYLWEWGHRFLARIVGLIALVPFIYFLIKKKLSNSQIIKASTIVFLIAVQGYIGWYMVQSGLSERVDVSQYRLATHLTMAFIIIYVSFFLLFDILNIESNQKTVFSKVWSTSFVSLVFLQIFLGGIVSGLDGGLIYPTWPLMGNSFMPLDYWNIDLGFFNLFENRSNIQFNHRSLAYLILFFSIINIYLYRKDKILFKISNILFVIILIQILFGVVSIIYYMPWQTALLHQFFAIVLFSISIFYRHLIFVGK
tara:strand:+ start:1286 stop:2308 length:1023 start_codon:yes stop_codon:yes gene_type:complete